MKITIMKLKGDGHVAGYVPLGEPCFAGQFYMDINELKADMEKEWQVSWVSETETELVGQVGYRRRGTNKITKIVHL